jgi:uncharacterized protein YqgC (DUF456 family)
MVTLITAVFIVLAGLGVLFSLIPFAPSMLLMTVIMALYGMVDGFNHFTIGNLIVILAIYLVSFLVDNFVGIAWARYKGATFASLMWGMLGMIFGFVLFPPVGAIFGMFIGVFFSELYHKHSTDKAFKIAKATVVGQIAATIINFTLAFVMFLLFVAFIFWI